MGIAGPAGIAIELVRLYQVELEHYEKIEGAIMSLEGKAIRLASMIRGNLAWRCGPRRRADVRRLDLRGVGRIYSYDVTGGCYMERGPPLERLRLGVRPWRLKKLWRPASVRSRPSAWPSRRSTTRPTTTPPPAARPRPADLADGGRRRPVGARFMRAA